jgi:hypothetical protein
MPAAREHPAVVSDTTTNSNLYLTRPAWLSNRFGENLVNACLLILDDIETQEQVVLSVVRYLLSQPLPRQESNPRNHAQDNLHDAWYLPDCHIVHSLPRLLCGAYSDDCCGLGCQCSVVTPALL